MPSIALPVSLRGQLLSGTRTASFSPLSLFAASEPGVWYDPSDLTTMFTDTAGTTPVTTPGQIVALLLDKSKGLALGSEVLVNGTFDGDSTTGWTLPSGSSVSGGKLVLATPVSNVTTATTVVIGKAYQWEFTVSNYTSGTVNFGFGRSGVVFGATGNGTYRGIEISVGATTAPRFLSTGSPNASIDNISVRELSGFHATQATAASRPTYGIVPLGGRRNLLTFSEQFDNAAWAKITGGVGVTPVLTSGFTDPDGGSTAWRLQLNAGANGGSDYSLIRQSSSSWPDSGTRSIWLRSNTGSDQTVTLVATNSSFRVTVTSTWQRFSSLSNASAKQLDVSVGGAGSTGATADILIWHPQFEAGSTATAYQRVTTQYDVTESGVQSLSYLFFDGVANFLVTPTITPGVDKAQVFVGVRKLSDAARGTIVEHSATIASNNGSFHLTAPNAASATFGFESKGTTLTDAVATFAAPTTRVVTGVGDIAGDSTIIRANGTQQEQDTADQGTGNYLAYPIYIGRRGGTTLPFSGQIYSMIVRFGANLDAGTITSTETFVNQKTGAF